MASIRDRDVRDFLSSGTRTGKVAWVGSDGAPHVAPICLVHADRVIADFDVAG